MATKRFKELKKLTQEQLPLKLCELEEELLLARMKLGSGTLENRSSIWCLKKDRARVKMLMGKH